MKWPLWIALAIVLVIGGFFLRDVYNAKQGPDAELSDGKHLGFIHALTGNQTSIDFDDAEWLTGKAAEDAAIRAGICSEDTREECAQSDFFIENEDVNDVQLALGPKTKVVMQTWKMEETEKVESREIGLADFAAAINNPDLQWRDLPYSVTIASSTVIRIEEMYVP